MVSQKGGKAFLILTSWKTRTTKITTKTSFVSVVAQMNVAERLRHRSFDQKVPSSIPRSGISVEVTSLNAYFLMLYVFNVVCASRRAICIIAFVS